MNHVFTKNGVVSYELEPIDTDDKYVIEMMKSRPIVTMRQSSKGGIIFELKASTAGAPPIPKEGDASDETPVDLSNVQRAKP